ncbi:hypothetical protein TcasGA2_TC010647 [Tribolium castaneum]|uniref:Uncharacterized protein n=1 Tax=Tribolium castaneum TaxID=7070 RepID=D6X2J5_TRICA|nr:PREDICTED: uncharacterized protein LOC103314785 [Tribolium castaneum]EFA09435.2 hypothetical protein TcasGA2_TC010647 [Tribolium castaneum]|eukprot:XP_008199905.2 PREDICTED: uncharacterized protein LOC103314785 [Tribolium castaneum]
MTDCQIQAFLFLVLIILGNAEDLDEGNGNRNKFNVVLFLAKTNTCETYSQDSGIRFLQFVETKRVKHCATGITEVQPVESCTSQGNDCEELLKTGIYSLISFCRNTMGMTTAVASVDNDTFSDGLRFRKSTSEDLEIRFHHPRNIRSRLGGSPNQKNRPESHLITQPEHTEVFKIRSKREFHIDNNNNQGMTPVDENDPNFDIFGIMANIKLTFFGKLFDQDTPANKKPIAQLQNNVMNQIGKVTENSLFDLVKETLNNVQDCRNGFLMIVIGGCLKDVSDIYSPLMQSVKHIVENTDPQNTLIVLTGQCPGGENNNQQFTIPVYTRGPPKCSGIAVAEQLYDVPYAIKNMLTENYGGSFFPSVKSKRSKRNIDEKRNSAPPTHPLFLFPLFLALLTTVYK